jgi:peptide/nickel transport system substrate-binding protein
MWSMGFIAEPKHYLSQFHITYNAKANDLAKAGGLENWTQLFNARQGPYGKSSDDIGRPVLEAWVLQEAATDYALWERNPFYWKVDIAGNQLPYYDRVQNRSAATKESFMIAAMGGEVDFVASILTIEDFPVLTQNAEAGNYEVRLWQKRAGAGVNYFFRQTYKPDPVIEGLLRDKRFRRALSLAINRAEINELLYFGKGTPSQAAVPPGSVYHVPEHFQRDAAYDPDEANRILDELGLKMGGDGIRRRPDGKELFVKIEGYHEQETPITSTAELVKNYWEAVGVKTDFDFREDNSFDGKRSADEVMIASHVIDMLPDSIYEGSLWSPPSFGWWSEELANVYFAEGIAGLRAAGMEPALLRFFELSEQFAQTAGEDDRVAIANQIGELWADNLWMVGTVGGDLPHPALVKNDMGNVASEGFATYFTFYQIPHLPAQYFRR